jgi:hypothetical protein
MKKRHRWQQSAMMRVISKTQTSRQRLTWRKKKHNKNTRATHVPPDDEIHHRRLFCDEKAICIPLLLATDHAVAA